MLRFPPILAGTKSHLDLFIALKIVDQWSKRSKIFTFFDLNCTTDHQIRWSWSSSSSKWKDLTYRSDQLGIRKSAGVKTSNHYFLQFRKTQNLYWRTTLAWYLMTRALISSRVTRLSHFSKFRFESGWPLELAPMPTATTTTAAARPVPLCLHTTSLKNRL